MKEEKNQNVEAEETVSKVTEEVVEENPLEKELEKAKALADEYKDKWMRNVAEFDNYKKRNAKLWQDAYSEGKADVILKILPIGDNLDIALSMNLDQKTMDGIKLVKKKFTETLTGLGVEEINPIGQEFDPNVAEAIMQVEKADGEESDTVKQVFEKGYRTADKIIRYAKVSVIK